MIVKCKICDGKGKISGGMLDFSGEICPACKGAGEYELTGNLEDYTMCKSCGGVGHKVNDIMNIFPGAINICDGCKGVGLVPRPVIKSLKESISKNKSNLNFESSKVFNNLHPFPIILSFLFDNFNIASIISIINFAGMQVNWELNKYKEHSDEDKCETFIQRIQAVFNRMEHEEQLTIFLSITKKMLEKKGHLKDSLCSQLERIGWNIADNNLIPEKKEISEIFFGKEKTHDAYTKIRALIEGSNKYIYLIDRYVDRTIFDLLKNLGTSKNYEVKILTFKKIGDFDNELKTFNIQYKNIDISIKTTSDVHDRFLILDNDCFHFGASIKDAGKKAFMINKIEDKKIKSLIITFLNKTWSESE